MPDDTTDGLSRRGLLRTASAVGATGAIGLAGNAAATETTVDPYDDPEYPSDEWFAREQSNWEKTREEPIRQANDPGFQKRWEEQSATNYVDYRRQQLAESEWDRSGLCRRWTNQCTGDPYRYPENELWSGDSFYEDVGDVQRVVFYDRADDAARLNGRVWAPADAEPGDDLPGVVVMCGGAATETMYWWFAQSLVEAGYVALTFDPNGQGRSRGAVSPTPTTTSTRWTSSSRPPTTPTRTTRGTSGPTPTPSRSPISTRSTTSSTASASARPATPGGPARPASSRGSTRGPASETTR